MILFTYAWKNMKKELPVYILTILQLSVAIIITLIMVSSVVLRFRYYEPFQDIFQSNGIYCYFPLPANADCDGIQDSNMSIADEEIRNYIDGVKEVISCNYGPAWCVDDNGDVNAGQRFINLFYDDEIIKRYTPEIVNGRWLNTSDKANCIEAVVSQNEYGWKTGDVLTLGFFAEKIEDIYAQVLIVGELKENTRIPGYKNGESLEKDCNIFYGTASFETEQMPFLLLSSNYLSAHTTISQGLFDSVMITFPEDYTKEMINEQQKNLAQYNCIATFDLEEINKNSKKYILEQVYQLLPIILVLLVLVMVSGISSSALSVRRDMRSFAIFSILGLPWKKCGMIKLIQSLIISISSCICAGIFGIVMKLCGMSEYFAIIFEYRTVAAVVGIILFYLLISMLMPILLLGKTSPKQLLTK